MAIQNANKEWIKKFSFELKDMPHDVVELPPENNGMIGDLFEKWCKILRMAIHARNDIHPDAIVYLTGQEIKLHPHRYRENSPQT